MFKVLENWQKINIEKLKTQAKYSKLKKKTQNLRKNSRKKFKEQTAFIIVDGRKTSKGKAWTRDLPGDDLDLFFQGRRDISDKLYHCYARCVIFFETKNCCQPKKWGCHENRLKTIPTTPHNLCGLSQPKP